MLTWLHPSTGAGLCRSSQPMTGLGLNPSSPEDEQLLTAIRAAADASRCVTAFVVAAPPAPAAAIAAGNGGEAGVDALRGELRVAGSCVGGFDGGGGEGGRVEKAGEAGKTGKTGKAGELLAGAATVVAKGASAVGRDVRLLRPFVRRVSTSSELRAPPLAVPLLSKGRAANPRAIFARNSEDVDVAAEAEAAATLLSSTIAAELKDAIVSPVTDMPNGSWSGVEASGAVRGGFWGVARHSQILLSQSASDCGSGSTAVEDNSGASGGGGDVCTPDGKTSSGSNSGCSRPRSTGSGRSGGEVRVLRGMQGDGCRRGTSRNVDLDDAIAGTGEKRTPLLRDSRGSAATPALATPVSVEERPRKGEEGEEGILFGGSNSRSGSTARAGGGLGLFSAGLERGRRGSVEDARVAEEVALAAVVEAAAAGLRLKPSTSAPTPTPTKRGNNSNSHNNDTNSRPFGGQDAFDDDADDDDDDEDACSLSSSSVTSVASAPGSNSRTPLRSVLSGTSVSVGVNTAQGGNAHDVPLRPYSGPPSPRAGIARPSTLVAGGVGGGSGGGGGPGGLLHSTGRERTGTGDPSRISGVGGAASPLPCSRPRAVSVPNDVAAGILPGVATPVAGGDRPAAGAGSRRGVSPRGSERRRTAVLRIVDARPMISAKGNLIMGKGHEVISRLGGHSRASLTFLEIPNVHAMQQSFSALVAACCAREDDPAWLVNVHVSFVQ